jgi:hypothetical protein
LATTPTMPSAIATMISSRKRAIIMSLRSVGLLSGGPAAARHRRLAGTPVRSA